MEPDSGWDDSDSDSLWGWLSSIVDSIKTIWEKITNIPALVYNAFVDALNTLKDWLVSIWESISNLPTLILEGIKNIFIPDKEDLKEDINGLVSQLNHTFNLGIDSANWLVDSFTEEAIPDQNVDYTIPGVGEFNLKVFDTTYLIRGVEFFRPIIRGFVVLLLLFFYYKQILSFIGQDPGIAHHSASEYAQWLRDNNGQLRLPGGKK